MCLNISVLATTRKRILGARSQKESCPAWLVVHTAFAVSGYTVICRNLRCMAVAGGGGKRRVSERRTVIQSVFNFLVELPVISSLYLDPQAFQCCCLLLFRLMALGKFSKHLDQNPCHAH